MKNINILKILTLIFVSIAIFFASFFVGYVNSKSYATDTDEKNDIKLEKIETNETNNENIITEIKAENITIENTKSETLFDIFKFGDDIPEWMIKDNNITLQEYTYYPPVITINSDESFYKINNVGVNSTLKEVQEAMKEYTEFYSIHTPNVPNAGWYYLNDKGDIIIFDFIEDDLSYVSENVTAESKVVSVSLTNLIFFD